LKLYLYFVGKPRDARANAIAQEYLDRVRHYTAAEMREVRPDRWNPWDRHASARIICLDPSGKALDSGGFTGWIGRAEMEGRDMVFVVGGADGLPPEWRARAELLSLSPMTFPHELARAMLAEQIYRAFASLRGHPYPR
jgi:23S rRNA (pseudouridine1915-N3)-methyltransferase